MRALLGLLCALPLAASAQGFSFNGASGSATPRMNLGFAVSGADPSGTNFDEGQGSFSLSVEDRIGDPTARWGDKGSLRAEISLPTARYRVELSEAGFPKDVKVAPQQLTFGGVAMDVPVHYGSPLGLPGSVRAHAAFVLMGVGRVYRDDRLVSDHALIYAFANDRGTHADDMSHAQLAQARAGDSEVEIFATGLDRDQVQEGFIRFFFDDVNISVNGRSVASIANVDSVRQQEPEQVGTPVNTGMSGGATSGYGGSGGAGAAVANAVSSATAPAYAGTSTGAVATIPNQPASRTGPTPNPANGTSLQPVPLSPPSLSSTTALDVGGGQVTRVDRFVNGERVFTTGGTPTTTAPGSVAGNGVTNNNSGTGGSGPAGTTAVSTPTVNGTVSPNTNVGGSAVANQNGNSSVLTPTSGTAVTSTLNTNATNPTTSSNTAQTVGANPTTGVASTTLGTTGNGGFSNVNGTTFVNGSPNGAGGASTPPNSTGQLTDLNNGEGSAGGLSDSVRPANSNPAAPLPPTVRPANADPAAPFPPSPSTLSANVLTPFPPTVRPANSNAAPPVDMLSPVNANSPAPGVTSTQFPGLTASSTNLPVDVSTTGTGSGIAGFGTTTSNANTNNGAVPGFGTTNSASNVGTNNGSVPGFDTATSSNPVAGFGTVLGGTSAQGTGLGTGIGGSGVATATANTGMNSLLPTSGLDTANIPGSNGAFAGLPVVGGAGTFPGLAPSSALGVGGSGTANGIGTTPTVTPGFNPAVQALIPAAPVAGNAGAAR